MKKRKSKKNKKLNRINNKIIIIIIAIIILIIILFFIAIKFTGRVIGQITGDTTSTPLYNCTDTDNGINYFEKGFCTDKNLEYEDVCYSEKGLAEYYCGRDKYACIRQETACPFGCTDGACKKILCDDSDNGKNYEIKGTVTLNNKEHLDYCFDNQSLMEYYCSGNSSYTSLKFECDNGCVDGACIGSSALVNESSEVIQEESPPVEKEHETSFYSGYGIFALIIIIIAVFAVFFFKKYTRK